MGKIPCRIYNPFKITRACSKAAGQTLQGLEQPNASQITGASCICLPGDPSHRAKQSPRGKSPLVPVLVLRKAKAVIHHTFNFGSPSPGLCSVSGRDKAGRTRLPREDELAAVPSSTPWAKPLTCLLCKKLSKSGVRGCLCPKSFGVWVGAGGWLEGHCRPQGDPGEVLPRCHQRRATANKGRGQTAPEPLRANFGLTPHPPKSKHKPLFPH